MPSATVMVVQLKQPGHTRASRTYLRVGIALKDLAAVDTRDGPTIPTAGCVVIHLVLLQRLLTPLANEIYHLVSPATGQERAISVVH